MEMIRPFLPGAGCGPPHLPKAGVLDAASVALRHEPLPAPARHLPHDVVVHDAGLSQECTDKRKWCCEKRTEINMDRTSRIKKWF